jgi:histidinol dehydrogenase
MKIYRYPQKSDWQLISLRPVIGREELDRKVKAIIADVKDHGDEALRRYSEKFDRIYTQSIKVTELEINTAVASVPSELKQAIRLAAENIRLFHSSQLTEEPVTETAKGVRCWRRNVPMSTVGLYIPGGTAPLFSTVLMLAVPAKTAGCPRIVMCTPPMQNGSVNPAVLYAAYLSGVTDIYKVGGAQAVAAMAYGTETVPRVAKIFGPGNQYVTRAKQLVQTEGVAIDMPAGPSEVLIIADSSANPEFLAADLLSQAEHGADSQVVLLSNDIRIIEKTAVELKLQLSNLPRIEEAEKALKNSFCILMNSLPECMEFSNEYAPEHLIIATENATALAGAVINAGSVFVGNFSCESAGDYASGTNHTLPTNGYAKSYSGVSTESFVRKITFQELSSEGLKNIGPAIEIMAAAENLQGHRNAVAVRLKSIGHETT